MRFHQFVSRRSSNAVLVLSAVLIVGGGGCASKAILPEWCDGQTAVRIIGLPPETAEFVVRSSDFEVTCDAVEETFECEGATRARVQGEASDLFFGAPFTEDEVTLLARGSDGEVLVEERKRPDSVTDDECGTESKSAVIAFELEDGLGGAGGLSSD